MVLAFAALSCGAFWLAVRGGWFGPDVGRGREFCEQAVTGLLRQPANTVSNLGFVIAGVLIAQHAVSGRGGGGIPRGPATAYALLVVALGPASAAMHATQSAVGGDLDLTSMFFVSSLALAYAVSRLLRRHDAYAVARVFLVALLAQEVAYFRGGRLPWIEHSGNLAFAVTILATVAIEVMIERRPRLPGDPAPLARGWLATAVGCLLVALGVWSLSKTGGVWCEPTSLVQGHAAWHVLCAGAAYALYRAYAGGGRDGSRHGLGVVAH